MEALQDHANSIQKDLLVEKLTTLVSTPSWSFVGPPLIAIPEVTPISLQL